MHYLECARAEAIASEVASEVRERFEQYHWHARAREQQRKHRSGWASPDYAARSLLDHDYTSAFRRGSHGNRFRNGDHRSATSSLASGA
jgi:hypothetical protein